MAQSRFIDAIIDVFNAEFFATATAFSHPSEMPLFVLGMPRSGTSLVEQIIASDHAVFGAGELTFFPQHIPALPARLATDKPFPSVLPVACRRLPSSLRCISRCCASAATTRPG